MSQEKLIDDLESIKKWIRNSMIEQNNNNQSELKKNNTEDKND